MQVGKHCWVLFPVNKLIKTKPNQSGLWISMWLEGFFCREVAVIRPNVLQRNGIMLLLTIGSGVRKERVQKYTEKGGMQVLEKTITHINRPPRTPEGNVTRNDTVSEYQIHSRLLLPSSKPSLKEPERLMVRVFSSSDMQEFLIRLSLQGSKETSWLVRLLLRRPARLI